jgi:lipopolysaccharide/colanic/teichoic acid biosynthesis glycosyltransferase
MCPIEELIETELEITPTPHTETQTEEKETLLPPKKRSGFRYGCYLVTKRLFDIVSSFLLLLVISPLLLLCLLIKWMEDWHNPIYVSKRVGKDGKIIRFLKIRTMCPNAEEMKQQLIAQGLNEADPPAFKMKNDPRITKFGKFLRKFSIDELLQVLNILGGSMSVVGPRPPIPSEVEEYTEVQMHRLDVKGGLLCLWQISEGRHDLSFDEWCALDFEYIEKQSFFFDLKIIFKGFFTIISGRSGD